ncbi:MAG: segregation/condensation protein A [Candidatus Omnitrophota bacterium]|nr:segregation/condensation protein A [Candidatus Omnitrophota bacterium]
MTYKVKLEVFEGPLDLLLYLIQKEEVDIYDIPIAKITDQYLEYLELMQLLDLNIAGEFLVMAATLMHIKSKLLLPPDETEEEAQEEDPRAELVRRLIEYKKFKEAASELLQMESHHKHFFARVGSSGANLDDYVPAEDDFFEASLFDLITAFTKVLKDIPKDAFYKVIKDEFTVSDKIHDILHMLVDKKTILFTELFKAAKNKAEIITIFLALLELIKIKEVVVGQAAHFGEIEIKRNVEAINPAPPVAETKAEGGAEQKEPGNDNG